MLKCSLKYRFMHGCVVALLCTLCISTVIQLFAAYGVYNYPHLPVEMIETQLFKQTSPKLPLKTEQLYCKYDDFLKNGNSLDPRDIPKQFDNFDANGIANGSYAPADCNPIFSVAILVTYRNRQKQLDIFLPYMHDFLRKQNIHYKIYVIEQKDEKPWNKGILYNVGAKQAISDKFPCLILHDVDLLPLDANNLYVCTYEPRHMSASIDKFRYVLTYDYLVGGVLAIKSNQFMAVNGFSNRFERWGGEDDDFAQRISSHKLKIVRFPRVMSRYSMMIHRPETKNTLRHRIMSENKYHADKDGLSSLPYMDTTIKNHRLFTLIEVRL